MHVIPIGNEIWVIGGTIVNSGEFNTVTYIYNITNDKWSSQETPSSLIGYYGVYGTALNNQFLFGVLEKDESVSPLQVEILSRSLVDFC